MDYACAEQIFSTCFHKRSRQGIMVLGVEKAVSSKRENRHCTQGSSSRNPICCRCGSFTSCDISSSVGDTLSSSAYGECDCRCLARPLVRSYGRCCSRFYEVYAWHRNDPRFSWRYLWRTGRRSGIQVSLEERLCCSLGANRHSSHRSSC